MIKSLTELQKVTSIELNNGSIRFIVDCLQPSTNSYIRFLRYTEYCINNNGILFKALARILKWKLGRLSVSLGITIPPNTCDIGLTIYHHGSIVVNPTTKIGKNCCIMNNVNIGANGGSAKSPQIGSNVYIGPGAVIYGDITIADNSYIGANAVVNKSFTEPYSVIAGIPAKIIKKENIVWWQKNRMKRDF